MLYNVEKQRVRKSADCISCSFMDKKTKTCAGGIGKRCFEYDAVAGICIDPVTRLPIKIYASEK